MPQHLRHVKGERAELQNRREGFRPSTYFNNVNTVHHVTSFKFHPPYVLSPYPQNTEYYRFVSSTPSVTPNPTPAHPRSPYSLYPSLAQRKASKYTLCPPAAPASSQKNLLKPSPPKTKTGPKPILLNNRTGAKMKFRPTTSTSSPCQDRIITMMLFSWGLESNGY